MQRGIVGEGLIPTDLFTSIEVADAAGYDVLELWAPAATAFLAEGHAAEEIAAKFESVALRPHSIAPIENIDIPEGPERERVIELCQQMCQVAQVIGCPNIQVVSGTALAGSPWATIRKETAKGLRGIADILAEYGLNIAYEPLAWTPVASVEQALEVIDEAGRPNVGLLVDTSHVYAGEGGLEAIRKLNPEVIRSVHLGDSAPQELDVWSDDDRCKMPGDGIVPLRKIMRAILDTGYDDVVSDEIWSARYASWTRLRIAEVLKAKGDAILTSL